MSPLAIFFIVAALAIRSHASISTAILKSGDPYLIREAENDGKASALIRNTDAGRQKMQFDGQTRGVWVDESGNLIDSSNFQLFSNKSVLIKSATLRDAGTYQKDPNPMIRIGDMGYAPPILIVQVNN